MTNQNDSAELLLNDLENLRKLLDENSIEEEILADDLEFDLGEHIPVLADRVSLPENPVVNRPSQGVSLPDDEISLIIDNLVAEYLPEIEKKLRSRLLDALSI